MYNYIFIYFVGIGGIGMSALARLYKKLGYQVFGYDKTNSELLQELTKEGISIHYDDLPSAIPGVVQNNPSKTLIIYTPAVTTRNNAILHYLHQHNYTIRSRAEVLGMLSEKFSTICIAGTHGKTSTSAMIAHIMHQSSIPTLSFVGGILNQYNNNLIANCPLDKVEWMVAEADEFNKSFLHLSPTHSIITAVDADHPETYTHFYQMGEAFLAFVKQTTQLLIVQSEVVDILHIRDHCSTSLLTYSLHQGNVRANNIEIFSHHSTFNYIGPSASIFNLSLPLPGLYNIENALAAITICLELGISADDICSSMACFPGIKRRFTLAFKSAQCSYIDDYAHHPTEIRCLLTSVRKIYPNSTIVAIFQPHLFSRTLAFYQDFAKSLSLADQIFLLPIYPARETAIPGVTSAMIFSLITSTKKWLITKDEMVEKLTHELKNTTKHQVVLTIGAGDIGEAVATITTALQDIFATAS